MTHERRRRALPGVVPVLRVLLSSASILIQNTHALSEVSEKATATCGATKLSPFVEDPFNSKELAESTTSRTSFVVPSLFQLPAINGLRGGQSIPPYDPYQQQQQPQQNAYYVHPVPNDDNYNSQQPSNNYEDGFDNYNPPLGSEAEDQLFQESVQERVDRWKSEQLKQYGQVSAYDEANPRDANGRLKLLQNVGKGSRALIFLIVMWRDIYLLELADMSFKGGLRVMVRTFLGILFVGNMAGTAASITSQGHTANKRLKAILNLDKLVEATLLCWSFLRLTILPTRFVPRETFIVGIFHSLFFIVQMQAFTRLTWEEGVAPVVGNNKSNSQSQAVGDRSSSEYRTLGQMDTSDGNHPNVYTEASDTRNSYYDQRTPT
jgi:hypothetical protein